MRALQAAEKVLAKCIESQQSLAPLGAFVNRSSTTRASEQLRASNGPLTGSFLAVKDNISTSELPTTCGSRGLETYTSPYDATVVSRARAAGATVLGKANLDEFGMGSHSLNSAFGGVKTLSSNNDKSVSAHSVGGSSGGSAAAVATRQCDFALGTDTGGSVRLPAAYTDTFAFKPSYGLVSRWGVVAYANSLDTVGFLGRNADGVRSLFDACNAFDPKDPTSLRPSTRQKLSPTRLADGQTLRIGVPKEYNISSLGPAVRAAWSRTLAELLKRGHTIHAVSLPMTEAALSAYYILAPAEASSNLAKFDSVRYGSRPPPAAPADAASDEDVPEHEQSGSGGELFARSRTYGFGAEVRRRVLLGAYSLSAAAADGYFVQAQRVRRLVQRDFNGVFAAAHPLLDADAHTETAERGVDVLVAPTAPRLPPSLAEVEGQSPLDAYAGDVFTVPSSLAGLPVANVPVQMELPADSERCSVGMQIMGQFGQDELVLDVAKSLEGICYKRADLE